MLGRAVVGVATGGAGRMPELSHVPLGPRRGPRIERRHRTVPSASEEVFGPFRMRPFLGQLLLQRAIPIVCDRGGSLPPRTLCSD